MAFTSHADASFDVCFENYFSGCRLSSNGNVQTILTVLSAKGVAHPSRHVELDIDIGADAKDWSAVQATEKLKPVETELRRIEEMVAEIVAEMDYLRTREQKLRDTNESTNTRVKWFAFGTMGMLVALGAWQVIYLRAYFRYDAEPSGGRIRLANRFTDQSISSKFSITGTDGVAWQGISRAANLLVLLVSCRIGI
jgi:hypothetical protein